MNIQLLIGLLLLAASFLLRWYRRRLLNRYKESQTSSRAVGRRLFWATLGGLALVTAVLGAITARGQHRPLTVIVSFAPLLAVLSFAGYRLIKGVRDDT